MIASAIEYQRVSAIGRMPSMGPSHKQGLDVTCIDSDDDDLEFEPAGLEEEEDRNDKDLSAFLISN